MATLRALPSVSALLNQPQRFVSRVGSETRLSLKYVKLSSTRAVANPERLIQGLSDEGRTREELGIWEKDSEAVEAVESSVSEFVGSANGALESFVKENARELAIGSLVFALVCLPDEHALALGPGGPLMEEFWDNVRRYGFYFFTVVSGGLYSLAKPLVDLLKDPSTQILVLIAVIGTFYLVYLTVSTMLGLNDFEYQYAQ